MLFLIARASRIMVISQHSRDITCRVYGAPSTIIEVIEHGGPDRPFERQAAFKQTLGLDGRTVLMTFGLLSPGDAGRNKAMALFPERINGLYTMIGRHDGENLFLLRFRDPFRLEPRGRAVDGASLSVGVHPDRQLR